MSEGHMPTTRGARSALAPALLAFWAWRAVAAALVATPLALELGAAGGTASSAGDNDLFAPGLLFASDVARRAGLELSAALKAGLCAWLVLAVLGALPLGALLSALDARRAGPLRSHFSRAAAAFPTFIGSSVILLIAQAAWLLASSLFASGLAASFGHGGRAAVLAPLAAYAVGLLGVLALGVLLDLARACALNTERGARAALLQALRALKHHARAAYAGYFACAGCGLLVVALAAWLAERCDVSRSDGWRVGAALAVHQLALLALVLLRARWLALAVELSASDE